MLARKKAIVEEIEIQKMKDVALILVDKEEIQRPAHIVILQDIVSLPTGKNILRSCLILGKKLTSRRKLRILAVLSVMVKRMVFLLILHHS